MKNTDYQTVITVQATAEKAFNSINRVKDWWSAEMEGDAEHLNSVFTVYFGETSITVKLVEWTPYQKIRWQVIDCFKHYLKDKKEWKGTEMIWEISTTKNETQIRFTHLGLIPGIECYEGCEKVWNFYLKESLFKLLTRGKGIPELA